MKPSNVLVIITDQLRADHLGFMGVVPVSTPNLDRLAAQGRVFTNAYVANPVCMPNRATIITGRWPSAHGLRTNGLPLDPESETFVRNLRQIGYHTSAVGKLHYQPMGYPYEDYQMDQIRAAMPSLWEASVNGPFGESFESWEDFDRHARAEVTLPSDYYGFDDVALISGHGDRVSGNYLRWAQERGFDPLSQAGWANAISTFSGWNHVYESATPAEFHPTTYVAEEASKRIIEYADSGDSFCMFVSFPDPHHPFAPPAEYFHKYSPKDMPIPPTFEDSHLNSPAHIKGMLDRQGTPDVDPMMLWAPIEDQFRAALAAELGSIEFIDDSIGVVLRKLEASGLLDETVVVFTSDHGDVFGDHGLILKHFTHYKGVVRVPLIISGPGISPGVSDSLVSSADIGPTILDILDAPPLTRAQGKSLTPILRGETDAVRGALLVEEDQPFGPMGLSGPVRMRTIITSRYRLTQFAGTEIVELFDLVADPNEMVNVAESPEHADLLSEARFLLLQLVMQTADDSTLPFHAA